MIDLIPVTPHPYVRQTQADRWKKRPSVLRYRDYRDALRMSLGSIPQRMRVVFGLPFPKSYSKKRRRELLGTPHLLKPDTDNLLKAVQDAVCTDDSHIYEVWMTKIWVAEGFILIADMATLPPETLLTERLVPRPILYSVAGGAEYLMVG